MAAIDLITGDIFNLEAEALVNPVNCVGVMGRGLALQFKKAFPANFSAYAVACKASEVQPGQMFVYDTGSLINPHYIINFPTKRHWKDKSYIGDIESGLVALAKDIETRCIRSVAVPPLGAGLGGLDWREVLPLIKSALSPLPDLHVVILQPAATPTLL